MRAWLHSMSRGPPIMPIRRWPSSIRCSVAARPPAQLVAPTLGDAGSGRSTGSMTTSGEPACSSCARCSGGSTAEVTRMTPSLSCSGRQLSSPARRRASPSADERHDGADAALGALGLDAAEDLHRPRAVEPADDQVDQAGPAGPVRLPRRAGGSCGCAAAPRPARGSRGRRRSRPLTTLETVAWETPASAAMRARVGRCSLNFSPLRTTASATDIANFRRVSGWLDAREPRRTPGPG